MTIEDTDILETIIDCCYFEHSREHILQQSTPTFYTYNTIEKIHRIFYDYINYHLPDLTINTSQKTSGKYKILGNLTKNYAYDFEKLLSQKDFTVQRMLPDQTLMTSPDDVYLQRWKLLRNKFLGNIYLHEFHRSDNETELHDHPFDGISIVLDGQLREITPSVESNQHCRIKHIPGTVIYRSAAFPHRLELLTETCTTMFITGPKIQEWGFYADGGWTYWKDFLRAKGIEISTD